ncbi:TPA: HAD family hydrolase [Photobacterium damselae]
MYIFDLCGTIVKDNTTFSYVSYVTKQERNYIKYIKSIFYRTYLFKLCMIILRQFSISHRELVINLLSGYSKKTLVRYADEYAEITLKNRVNKRVVDVLSTNISNSLIASASLDIIVHAFCAKLNVKKSISTSLLYNNDICLGKIDPLTDTKGKKDKQLNQYEINYVATDNYDDYALCYKANKVLIVTKRKKLNYWHHIFNSCNLNEIEIILK